MMENMMLQLYDDPCVDKENDDTDSEDQANSDNLDREELEIALYSQIHFETSDTVDAPEGLQDDDVTGQFLIDVIGNDKTGFQTSLTTADYVTNEIINTEYGTSLHLVGFDTENSLENRKLSQVTKTDYTEKTAAKQLSLKQSYKEVGAKFNNNKNLAEKLILKTGSSSESEDVNDKSNFSGRPSDSDNWESDSDEDLIDLDLEDSEDDTGLFVNVSRNQRPLLEPNNVNEWSIDADDIPDFTSRFNKSRYYKPINITCHNCDKIGHLSKNCPEPKKEQTCGFCSESGHHMKICPHAFCYNCEEPGHIAKECSQPKRKWFTQCSRCSMQGHKKSKCPDQWRQYHKTVDGKKLIKNKKNSPQRNTFCYNCAGDDHLGHECEEDRMDRYSQPTCPFICNYIPVNYNYSQFDREYPCHKQTKPGGKTDTKKKIEDNKNKIPHSFVKKERLPRSTGRSNFDKLLFSNHKIENKNKTFSHSSVKRNKRPHSTGILFDEYLYSSNKSGNDFKFGFKSPAKETKEKRSDSLVGGSKRKDSTEDVSASKKPKTFDNSKKKARKRFMENHTKESPKHQKMNKDQEDSMGTVSVTVTNKDSSMFKEDFAKKRNVRVADTPVNRSPKRSSFKTKQSVVGDKRMKKKSNPKSDSFNDERKIAVTNKEEDFPRGGLKKNDTFCDEISVSFANNLIKSVNNRKSERGFLKTKKFETLGHSDECGEGVDHQAYRNEWWLKKEGRKNKKNERKNN